MVEGLIPSIPNQECYGLVGALDATTIFILIYNKTENYQPRHSSTTGFMTKQLKHEGNLQFPFERVDIKSKIAVPYISSESRRITLAVWEDPPIVSDMVWSVSARLNPTTSL